jgi:hypothetical protein
MSFPTVKLAEEGSVYFTYVHEDGLLKPVEIILSRG